MQGCANEDTEQKDASVADLHNKVHGLYNKESIIIV
jgi:hypothetical protein